MESTKSNKIKEIVRLQQILKKWKKLANTPNNNKTATVTYPTSNSTTETTTPSSKATRGINFLKRTLSFTDVSAAHHQNDIVPKGFLAVCVGKELKRFIIPTDYLGHQAFRIPLQEAEEEFGFQQAGVLKIPCEVCVFEKILKVVEEKREDVFFLHEFGLISEENNNEMINSYCSSPSDCELTPSHHPQMCRCKFKGLNTFDFLLSFALFSEGLCN